MKNHTNDDDLLPILPPMLLRTEAVYNFTYGNFSIIVEKVFTKTPEQINYVNSNDNYYAYQLTHRFF
jgi:hypothetical protein